MLFHLPLWQWVFLFLFLLKYSWCTILYMFQVNNIVIHNFLKHSIYSYYKIFAISLCCTICPCNLFILYIVVCVSQSQTPILALPSFLLPLDIWNDWMKTSKRRESSVPHSRTGTKQNPVWGLSFFSISCPRGHSMAKKAAATATAGVQETKDSAQAHSLERQIWQCEARD